MVKTYHCCCINKTIPEKEEREEFTQIMKDLGWYRVKHTLPIKKKFEYRYHRNGSELTEEEAYDIFSAGTEYGHI